MIKYYKLFDLLARRGMKKTDLLEVISPPTLAKIGKGKNIQTDNIDRICLFLKCQPGDIMECITDIDEIPEHNIEMYTSNVIFDESNKTFETTNYFDTVNKTLLTPTINKEI